MCSLTCHSEGYTISVSADGSFISVGPSEIVQNADFASALALCGGGLGYFPGPCPLGANITLIKNNALAHDGICRINGTYIIGQAYSVRTSSPIGTYGPVQYATAGDRCGSIANLVDAYNSANPAHPIPQCQDRECMDFDSINSMGEETGVDVDNWFVIAKMAGGIMAPGSKACSLDWPAGPVADGYTGPRPPATWYCPAGTTCSASSIGGCNGSTYSNSPDTRKMVSLAQNILTSKVAQSCLAAGRIIGRDADNKLRCYGAGKQEPRVVRINAAAARTAAGCWNAGGAVSDKGGKMVCVPNISGAKERKTELDSKQKN
jgi:hypothetical protein